MLQKLTRSTLTRHTTNIPTPQIPLPTTTAVLTRSSQQQHQRRAISTSTPPLAPPTKRSDYMPAATTPTSPTAPTATALASPLNKEFTTSYSTQAVAAKMSSTNGHSTTVASHPHPNLKPQSHLHRPLLAVNNGAETDTSLPHDVRRHLRTYGLTPPVVETHELQAMRCLNQLALKEKPIEKYIYLSQLRNHNVHLFYRLVVDHMKELTPLIYTPVVGEACLKWSEIFQQPEGLYISYSDRGRIASVLDNWPQPKVEITVVTDGSRILGLGDLGINGMGIPVGKLALYTGCAGIHPDHTLPLTLDLGTNNKKLWNDPLYMGSKREKVTPEEEQEFLDELMTALNEKWPGIVIQFEDFKNPFPALARYRDTFTCFNDDIQGTGSVVLAGVINAVKRSGIPSKEQRAVFMGAGSAGVGVAKQIVEFFIREGLTEDEARRCFWLVDTKGLVTNDRGDKLADHKVYFSRDDNDGRQIKSLAEVVEYVKPTILMGLSTIGGIFDEHILKRMGEMNERPIIFPLSNPSSQSECTFEEAMKHTGGRALFASGSPFPSLMWDGKLCSPGQGNNMYVFPGIGLGAILSRAVNISQEMIYASAEALSTSLTAEEVAAGWLYPDVSRIREVSVIVARGVIRMAQSQGLDRELVLREMGDEELDAFIQSRMYDPHGQTRGVTSEVRGWLDGMSASQALGLAGVNGNGTSHL